MKLTPSSTRLPGAAVVLAFGLSLACALLACVPDPAEWFPSGEAVIMGFREREDSGTKYGRLSLRLDNTGRSIIRASTVSVSLGTGARRYFRTLTDTRSILPGGMIFIELSLAYDDVSESALEGEPRMENSFFE